MCGILGIIDKYEEVFERAAIGTMALQHRGQDAAGILTSGDKFYIKKGKGLAMNIFTEDDAENFKGKIGIGHTRYPTVGGFSISESQPFFLGNVAMAFNGNITNHFELKELVTKKGVTLKTSSDIEPVINIFASEYKKTGDFFQAAAKILEIVKGGYSIVGLIEGVGLFAIRDPHGIRPLAIGKKDDSLVFASESVSLQMMGYDYMKDVEAGEAILITPELEYKNKIINQKKKAHCMFEWVYFASPNSMIEERSVYKVRLALGKLLGEKITGKHDAVIPVPDTSRTAAIKLADEIGIRYREGLIKNRYLGRTFIMPSQKAREQAVTMKLMPIISMIQGKDLVVVDDSIVRGTTSKKIVKLLKHYGTKKITFASTCPPLKYPCYYGVDMHSKKELIASEKSVEEIRDYIGADELIYATIEDIKKAIRRDVCTACLDGDYPEEISTEQKEELSNQRKMAQNEIDSDTKKLNILVIGSGGREHAIVQKISESTSVNKIFAVPGNPGIAKIAECEKIDIMDNESLINYAKDKNIDLVIVGPEDPLANGVVDALTDAGIRAFGPNKKASQFEASKIFTRNFLKKYGLPSCEYETFQDYGLAKEYIESKGAPIVVKADGLAAGKGAFVAHTTDDAIDFAKQCLVENRFNHENPQIIVEECLFGEEASYLVFVDSKTFVPMVYSQDHKAIGEGDTGLNTGGMGAYSPAPILDGYEEELSEKIMKPFLHGCKEEGIEFKGVLYVGLMKTDKGLKIIEYNNRFGDPEAQIILPRLRTDLIKVMNAVIDQKLSDIKIEWSDKHCMALVAASGGYPEDYEKGKEITIGNIEEGVQVIHAGTKNEKGNLVTNGGRVLNVVAVGDSLQEAADKAYKNIKEINFEGMYYRNDIGKKELDRCKNKN